MKVAFSLPLCVCMRVALSCMGSCGEFPSYLAATFWGFASTRTAGTWLECTNVRCGPDRTRWWSVSSGGLGVFFFFISLFFCWEGFYWLVKGGFSWDCFNHLVETFSAKAGRFGGTYRGKRTLCVLWSIKTKLCGNICSKMWKSATKNSGPKWRIQLPF